MWLVVREIPSVLMRAVREVGFYVKQNKVSDSYTGPFQYLNLLRWELTEEGFNTETVWFFFLLEASISSCVCGEMTHGLKSFTLQA